MYGTVGDVAQLVEHLLCKQGVGGSSPLVSTLKPAGRDFFSPLTLEPLAGKWSVDRLWTVSPRSRRRASRRRSSRAARCRGTSGVTDPSGANAEDDDIRHEYIFAAHKALVEAEAVF